MSQTATAVKRWKALVLALGLCPAGAAFASDAAYGEVVYRNMCSSCHEATASNERRVKSNLERPRLAPNLGVVAASKNVERLTEWVESPWAVKPDTRCDIRGLSPQQKDDLVAFIVSKSRPVPPPEQVRLKQDLARVLQERREKKGRELGGGNAPPPSSTTKKKGGR